MGAGPQPEPHSPWVWGLGQGGWLGLGATLRVLVRSRPRPWGGTRALHGKGGGAGPALGPGVVETVPQTPAAHSSSHSRSAATQVGPGDHCHHPPARARPAGAEDGQGVALCPLLSHWLFEGGSGPYPSDAPGGSPITQRRWEALPIGHHPLEAGGSEMAAGSVLGSGLNTSLKPEPLPLGGSGPCTPPLQPR